MPTSLSSAVLQVIVRERVSARRKLDHLTTQLGALGRGLASGGAVLEELPVAVARVLTLLHPGEVSSLLQLYEEVLAKPLIVHATRFLADATITLEVLRAAEVIALFELASGRCSPDVVAMGTVDRAARSGFCAGSTIHERLRMLAFAFGMDATTELVVRLGGDEARGSDARIIDRLDAALVDARGDIRQRVTAEDIAPTLPFFVTGDGHMRWNDLVWMTSGLSRAPDAGPEVDVFALIREAIGLSVADTTRESSRIGVRAGFADPIPTFRRGSLT